MLTAAHASPVEEAGCAPQRGPARAGTQAKQEAAAAMEEREETQEEAATRLVRAALAEARAPATQQAPAPLSTLVAELRALVADQASAVTQVSPQELAAATATLASDALDYAANAPPPLLRAAWDASAAAYAHDDAFRLNASKLSDLFRALGNSTSTIDPTLRQHTSFVDNWLAISPWTLPRAARDALFGSWCHLAASCGTLAPHVAEALCAHATSPPSVWVNARATAEASHPPPATTTSGDDDATSTRDRTLTAAADAVVMCRAQDVGRSWANAVAEVLRTSPSLSRAFADAMTSQAPHRRQPLGEVYAHAALYAMASERSRIQTVVADNAALANCGGYLLHGDALKHLVLKCVEVDGELRWEDLVAEDEELDVDEADEAAHAAIAAAVVCEDDDDDDDDDMAAGDAFGAPPSWNGNDSGGGGVFGVVAPSGAFGTNATFSMQVSSSPLIAGFGEGAAAMHGRAQRGSTIAKPPSAISVAKLDRMLGLLLEYVSMRCASSRTVPKKDSTAGAAIKDEPTAMAPAPSDAVVATYESLFPLFEAQLLPNGRCKFVHFAIFNVLSLEPGNLVDAGSRPCRDHFIGRLHQIALDTHQPFALRRCAMSHLASFGARAKACVQDADAVGLAEAWMTHVVARTGPAQNVHRLLVHGAMYILCFRACRACAASPEGAAAVSRALAVANRVLEQPKPATGAHQLSSSDLLLGCPVSVAEEFRSRVVSDLGFASDFAATGAYGTLCDFIARSVTHRSEGSGSVNVDAARSATPPMASRARGDHADDTGIFFPYDPYLLPTSRPRLRLSTTYLTWSGATRPKLAALARQAVAAARRPPGAPPATGTDVGDDIEGDVLLSGDQTGTEQTGEESERWRVRDGSDVDDSSDGDGDGDSDMDDEEDNSEDMTPPHAGIAQRGLQRSASNLSGLRRPMPLSGVRRARTPVGGRRRPPLGFSGAAPPARLAGVTRARADSGGSAGRATDSQTPPSPLYTPPGSFVAPPQPMKP